MNIYLIVGLIGFLLATKATRIFLRRIKSKTYVGDGGNADLQAEQQHFDELSKFSAVGLILVLFMNQYVESAWAKFLLLQLPAIALSLGVIFEYASEPKNGAGVNGYVVGRWMTIVAIGAMSIGLIGLELAKSFDAVFSKYT